MPILHVRNVPDDLYANIQRLAKTQNRSLSAQVIHLLDQALQAEETRQAQAKILVDTRRRRVAYPRNSSAPDSVSLLREDRER